MIIIEGPDGSGKSTFIKKLRRKGCDLLKPYYPKFNQLKYYLLSGPLYAEKYLERYYPSEIIYPRVKEGRTQMENYKQFLIEASLYPFFPLILYLRPSSETIKKNIASRGDHYINSEEEVDKLIEEYDKFMKRTLIPVIKYDYEEDDFEKIYFDLNCHEYNWEGKNIIPKTLASGNTISRDNIMFVGESPSNRSIGEGFIRPLISNKGSSLFFHECLYEAGGYNKKMPYFTNYYKFSSHEVESKINNGITLLGEIEWLRPQKIICLGNEVFDNVKSIWGHRSEYQGARYSPIIVKLEHPAFIKRFKNNKEEIKEYISNIQKAII